MQTGEKGQEPKKKKQEEKRVWNIFRSLNSKKGSRPLFLFIRVRITALPPTRR
jgi:hypothetical protein